MPDINNGQKYLCTCIISVFQYMLHEIHVTSIISIQTHKPDIISNICGGGGQADTSWVPVTVGMRQGTIFVGTSETMAF